MDYWQSFLAKEAPELLGGSSTKGKGLLIPLASLQQSKQAERERLVTPQEAQSRQEQWKQKLYCPLCQEDLSFVRASGDGKRAHFRHKPDEDQRGGAGGAAHGGEGLDHLLAKAFIQAKLSEITFEWKEAVCRDGRACSSKKERRFQGCTVVLEKTLGSLAGGRVALTQEEARLRPDVTILDSRREPVAFVEVLVTSQKVDKHWNAYHKFPQVVGLEVNFVKPPPKATAGGYQVSDVKVWAPVELCDTCDQQKQAWEKESLRMQRRFQEDTAAENKARAELAAKELVEKQRRQAEQAMREQKRQAERIRREEERQAEQAKWEQKRQAERIRREEEQEAVAKRRAAVAAAARARCSRE